jgi:hypothetical protein
MSAQQVKPDIAVSSVEILGAYKDGNIRRPFGSNWSDPKDRAITDVQPHDLDVGDESGDAYRIGIRRREDQETGEGEPQIGFESRGSVGLVSRTAIMSDSSNGPFG